MGNLLQSVGKALMENLSSCINIEVQNEKNMSFSCDWNLSLVAYGEQQVLTSEEYMKKLENYAQSNNEFTFLSVFTEFGWDECYNDIDYYGRGEEIAEKTGYIFELDSTVDHLHGFF